MASCTSFVRYTSEDSTNNESATTEPVVVENDYSEFTEDDFTDKIITGTASYYANKFHGRQTANGEIFDQKKYTAAHRSLPFGTKLLVTNQSNNKSVVVRINDRGPFVRGRILDLSRVAAEELVMIHSGITQVVIRVFK
jgi:peptidoglycan lytic transglycosylase